MTDPDETMHEGKPMIGKPTSVEIDGQDHELIVTREKKGVRVRLCSKSCDYVVTKLKAARDKLDDTPKNEPARAVLDELIAEGEEIDKGFATKADRKSRSTARRLQEENPRRFPQISKTDRQTPQRRPRRS